MADDFESALISRLRRGTSAPPVEVTAGPQDDPEAALIARLRADALTKALVAPSKANPRGQVLPTPGWDMGTAVANGMAQGLLPQIAGASRSNVTFPQNDEITALGGTPLSAWNPESYDQNVAQMKAAREAYGKENPGKAVVGEVGGSLATMIPAMAAGGAGLGAAGGMLARAAPWTSGIMDFLSGASKVRALQPAAIATRAGLEGTAAAGIGSNLSDAPIGEQLRTGGLVGLVGGPLGAAVANPLKSKVTGTAGDSVQALLDQGVPVRAGQIPGSNKVTQGLDKVFGGGNAEQREQFANALSTHAGYPTKEIDQAWVNGSKKAEGQTMNEIQSVYKIPAKDTDLTLDLDSARLRALSKFSDPTDIKKINGFFDKLDNHAAQGIDGPIYKNIVEKDGLISNFVSGDQFRKVAGETRDILDDAWGRSLPIDKKAAWDEARKRYRILDTIDNSMGATGAAEGVYNPKKLLAAVERKYGNVENAGELGMLARGGQFLEPPGAAPASSKHGAAKTIGGLALAGAAGAAASEGSKVISHFGPEAIAALTQHPESYTLPALMAMGLYGGGKLANAALNGPRATQYLLDVSKGSRAPMLRGNNPLIPLAVEGYNRQ